MSIGDSLRFWCPVALLALFSAYVGTELVSAHLHPEVKSIDYDLKYALPARRGTIYDRNGTPLVRSISVWDYRLDPQALTNAVVRHKGDPPRPPEAIVKTIANALGLDFRKVLEMSRRHSGRGWRNQYLSTSSDARARQIIGDSTLVAGVKIEDRHVRQYIQKRRASHVLGFVNNNGVGSGGIELRYDRYLTGVPGRVQGMKDAHGNELYDRRTVAIAPVPGSDVYLTLDHVLQYETESALADGLEQFGAASGWCVILDARTAAVLAMASLPDFDPIRYGASKPMDLMNRVTGFNYEPGSVMKVITAAAAIDTGRFSPDSRFSTDQFETGYYKLPGDHGHVWDPTMTLRDAIVHSSNIVIGKLGVNLGSETLYRYMKAFGFGQVTGVDLPGEQHGILKPWQEWDKASWSRAPIGQFVAVTALQMASAYQAIANDGRRMRPYIVERIVDAAGAELYRHRPEPMGQPISPETARTMREIMLGVASPQGTARRAAIKGYSIAGKTGTAQKAAGRRGYIPGLYRASFCGMAPASDPQLVVLVTLDFEKNAVFHQGGNSAAVTWRRVMMAALRYLMIQPDRIDEIGEYDEDDDLDRIINERAKKYDIILGN